MKTKTKSLLRAVQQIAKVNALCARVVMKETDWDYCKSIKKVKKKVVRLTKLLAETTVTARQIGDCQFSAEFTTTTTVTALCAALCLCVCDLQLWRQNVNRRKWQ